MSVCVFVCVCVCVCVCVFLHQSSLEAHSPSVERRVTCLCSVPPAGGVVAVCCCWMAVRSRGEYWQFPWQADRGGGGGGVFSL